MESIEQTFSDNKGNHLLVALYFYDNNYKQTSLHIPDEYADVEIVDIDIEKTFREKPIHPVVFFRMSSWLLQQFNDHEMRSFHSFVPPKILLQIILINHLSRIDGICLTDFTGVWHKKQR